MPRKERHEAQADHNRELAQTLVAPDPMPFKDWAVISAFYSAVHYVEAERAVTGAHSNEHLERLKYVRNNYHHSASVAYGSLYKVSRILRYLEHEYDQYDACAVWMPDEDARGHVRSDLDEVKQEALRRIEDFNHRNNRTGAGDQ